MKQHFFILYITLLAFVACDFLTTNQDNSIENIDYSCETNSIDSLQNLENKCSEKDFDENEEEDNSQHFFTKTVNKIRNINVFSVEDDIAFGEQAYNEIVYNDSYPILPREQYSNVYEYVESIRDNILQSSHLQHKHDFEWSITIIDADVLNAFVTPGGYIFFYTGLLKYMQSEAELASVMGHEIAHADRRHCTETMTKEYGLSFLLSILLGDDSMLSSIIQTLAYNGADLAFSRRHEYEADEYSLRYLTDIQNIKNYYPIALIDFFDRMQKDSLSESNGNFEFLRTHPYDDNRKQKLEELWESMNSPQGKRFENRYKKMVTKLP